MLKVNKLYNMDCREGLALLEDESIDCCISSPPYYRLRDYEIEPSIWDGNPNCEHEFEIEQFKNLCDRTDKGIHEYIKNTDISNISGFCKKCNAWKGCLGLEPSIDLFIKHLCDIYDIIKQKLKKTGTCWVNLGDTYSQGGRSGSKKYFDGGHIQFGKKDPNGKYQAPLKVKGFPPKSLLMIPERFAIEMITRGWILRNVIIWKKDNPVPESANDRFTRDYEYLYFFVKSTKTRYYINERSGLCLDKLPKERIENVDWEWRICNKCNGTGIIEKVKKTKLTAMNLWTKSPRAKYQTKNGPCKKCKGTGHIKHNFWSGRDYWFDQNIVREPLKESSKRRAMRGVGNHKYISQNPSPNGMKPHTMSFPREFKGYKDMEDKIQKGETILNPRGRNKRTVWIINTKPNPEAHFATFPPELVEIPIKSGCPEYICEICGKPREILYKNTRNYNALKNKYKHVNMGGSISKGRNRKTGYPGHISKELFSDGLTNCGCQGGWKSGIVLDPFAGTATTLREAFKLGRDFIGFEISKEYCKIANKYLSKETNFKRITDFTSKNYIEVEKEIE